VTAEEVLIHTEREDVVGVDVGGVARDVTPVGDGIVHDPPGDPGLPRRVDQTEVIPRRNRGVVPEPVALLVGCRVMEEDLLVQAPLTLRQ